MSRPGAKLRLQRQQERKKGAVSTTWLVEPDLPEAGFLGDTMAKKLCSLPKLPFGNSCKGFWGGWSDIIGSWTSSTLETSTVIPVMLVVLLIGWRERFPSNIVLYIIGLAFSSSFFPFLVLFLLSPYWFFREERRESVCKWKERREGEERQDKRDGRRERENLGRCLRARVSIKSTSRFLLLFCSFLFIQNSVYSLKIIFKKIFHKNKLIFVKLKKNILNPFSLLKYFLKNIFCIFEYLFYKK